MALPSRASVVVAGGGVIGASAAFHLAEAGVQEVVLVERGQLASGSTSRAAGGVRAQFSDPLNIALGHRSLAAFRAFGERPGWEIDLRQSGYLFVLSREEDVRAFEAAVALQQSLGVPSRLVSAEEAGALCPLLETGDVLAAAFSPDDGHCTPEAVVHGYAAGARAHGATVVSGCAVTGVEVEGGAVRAVLTAQGRIATDTVICAAGAWSGELGALAGVDLPVAAEERRIVFTEAMEDLPPELPMTIDFSTSFYFHREGPGLLVGMSHRGEDFEAELLAAAERRAPRVAQAGIRGGWSGLYEVTPDHNGLIGEAPHVNRFLYATGFSGHGFLQAPAVGEVLRDLVLGRAPVVDVTPLSAERFASDSYRKELHVV